MNKFEIKGEFYGKFCFPSLNNYINEIGRNPKTGGRFKKDYVKVATTFIRRDLKGFKTTKPIILHYTFGEPNKGHKRDVMNVFSLADKIISDTLRDLKVIPDDNPNFVKNCTHEFEYVSDPFIRVEIEELENEV